MCYRHMKGKQGYGSSFLGVAMETELQARLEMDRPATMTSEERWICFLNLVQDRFLDSPSLYLSRRGGPMYGG